ncbi:2-polyprenyl-6-methoxyphenol hydroxylase-like FAD-dependent oxidoreductase [Kitasatospora sp. MAA4]|uniref:FAD-dependent monooxygenase n=1 Tax=Kitasatospora sp. MAA4 TaxID=3035093 RepID=UPI0024767D5B|nr:FAD-dependent monooxygenase [Kitasatospora sp. MAA4]MDH6132534.1 2-polyprenyl-6-methoxyphenol hydroxylase-like FAD-dependent oxidoreductase [Kitasatospora sp. MAA4]
MSDPVLVVGAGPVGLTLAGELARRGVPVRIVDALAAPTTESRAIVVHARSLEMLEQVGVLDDLIASGIKTTGLEMHASGRTIARVDLDIVDSAHPYAVVTAQTETERVLTENLAKHGVEVERGLSLLGLEQDAEGVRATLRTADGGEESIAASWLVGADGARSEVRRQVGTALEGSFHGERFLMGDVHAAHDFDPRSMYTFFSAHDGPLMVFPMKGDRMRLIAQVTTGSTDEASQEWLQRVADERASGRIRIHDSLWLTCFEIHHAQVPQYRYGRVFLAGDAAHVHSPAGGQGMNTGMQDAFNLGWKLAAAYRGTASETLIDSYHAERHPVAARVIEFSTRLTHLSTLANPVAQKLRNALLHTATGIGPARQALADETEETTLSYHGSPAVVGSVAHAKIRSGDHLPDVAGTQLRRVLAAETGHVLLTLGPLPAAAELPGVRQILLADTDAAVAGYDTVVADPQRRAATRFGLTSGRIMVRPDGYVGAIAAGDDDAPITAYRELTTR